MLSKDALEELGRILKEMIGWVTSYGSETLCPWRCPTTKVFWRLVLAGWECMLLGEGRCRDLKGD